MTPDSVAGSPSPKTSARAARWAWLAQWARDLHFSFRALRRAPAFSLAVIATLTLCIGANTAVFSALYTLALKALPFAQPGQLVEVYNSFPNIGQAKRGASVGQYLDYKESADLFAGFAIFTESSYTAGEETDPARVSGARMTADYFSLLGVAPLLGRFYTMEDCVPGRDTVVVLTQTFWEKQYGADREIVGKTIRLTGAPYTVIGVAPRLVEEVSRSPVLFIPLAWETNVRAPTQRFNLNYGMYGRVKAGVAPATALAQLATLEKRFDEQSAPPDLRQALDRNGHRVQLGLIRAEQTKPIRTGLLLLQCAAGLVLLLGCLNVASLMLARANARQAELAVRQALGAGRGALASQMFAESLLLGLAGTGGGVALAWASLRVINRYTATIVRQLPPVELDGTILACAIGVTLLVAFAIGVIPVIRVWRTDLLGSIQGGSRGASAGGGVRTISGVLVTTQVALALVLLVGAGLMIRSFGRITAVDTGFDAPRIIHARVAFNAAYKDVSQAHRAAEQIVARLREIPGVEAVAITSHITIKGGFNKVNFKVPGAPEGANGAAEMFGVSPEFFPAMGIRLLEGRFFTAADQQPSAPFPYIVDRVFAERNFPGRSAVGQPIAPPPPNLPAGFAPLIVGVVDTAKFNGPDDQSGVPFVFGPAFRFQFNGFSMVIRTTRSLADMQPLMRAAVKSIDPSLPLYNVGTLDDMFDRLLSNRRGVMLLLVTFAAIALVLSAVGLYGMLAFDVSQRTREIGIRGAIGASRGQILGLILRQGLWRAGIGLVIGLVGAAFLSRTLASLLFDVPASDPVTFGAVSLLLLLVALIASYLPARRATKVDPIVALRCE